MARFNPFSFKGEIGRAEFWVIVLFSGLIGIVEQFLPVSRHVLALSPPHGLGQTTIRYATPLLPTTWPDWVFLALYYILDASGLWLTFAAMARRLRDLGRSVLWLGALVAIVLLHVTLEAAFSRADAPYSALEIANYALVLPVLAIALFGVVEMLFRRGVRACGRPCADGRGDAEKRVRVTGRAAVAE